MIFSSTHNFSQPLFENLLYGFGSPNYGTQRSLCFNAMIVAHLMTYGFEEPGRDYTQREVHHLHGPQHDGSHLDQRNERFDGSHRARRARSS